MAKLVEYLDELERQQPRRRQGRRRDDAHANTGQRVAFDAPPPEDAARIVRAGIERQARSDSRKRPPGVDVLLTRTQAIVDALAERDAVVLRGALVDMAALCERWATELPGGKRA